MAIRMFNLVSSLSEKSTIHSPLVNWIQIIHNSFIIPVYSDAWTMTDLGPRRRAFTVPSFTVGIVASRGITYSFFMGFLWVVVLV